MPSPRLAKLLSVAAVAAALLATHLPDAAAASRTTRYTGVDLADPGYLKTPGHRSGSSAAASQLYVIYGTGTAGGIPVRYRPSTVDGRTNQYGGSYQSGSRYALPTSALPSWVGDAPDRGKRLWAPTVFVRNLQDEKYFYVMYFTAWHKTRKQNCIGTARSTNPLGPFAVAGGPICAPGAAADKNDAANGLPKPEAIDPTYYRDGSGRNYLLFKTSVGNAKKWTIWALRMNADGTQRESGAVAKVVRRFGSHAENPAVVKRGDTFWLFVSEGDYVGCGYKTTAYKGSSLGGPWSSSGVPVLSQGSTGLCGPGGASIIRDGSAYRMAFHAWRDSSHTGARRTWVATLKWRSSGVPYVG